MVAAIRALFLGLLYRFRGGGYITTGSTTLVRVVWSLGFGLCTLFIIPAWQFGLAAIASSLAGLILVPHGFCQNAGTWPRPAWMDKPLLKRWPSAWFPQWTLEGWQAAPLWQKQAYDFAQMACVAFVRGAMVFVPFAVLGGDFGWLATMKGIAAITLLQPLSYQAGVHWMKWAGQEIPDGWWPEFLNGIAWGIALSWYAS